MLNNRILRFFCSGILLLCGLIFVVSFFYPIKSFPSWYTWLAGVTFCAFLLFLRNWLKPEMIPAKISGIGIKYVILAGFFLRLFWVLFSGNTQVSDFLNYQNMALDIKHGKYLFHDNIPSGTGMITALSYGIFGFSRLSGLLPVVLFSTATIYLVYRFVRVNFSTDTAIIAASICAVFPDFVLFSNLINSDVYFTFFLMLSVVFFFPGRIRNMRDIILSSASLAIAQYIRSNATIFVPVFIFILYLQLKEYGLANQGKKMALYIAVFLLVLLPVFQSNYSRHQQISANSSRFFGWSLLLSSNPVYNGVYNNDDARLLDSVYRISGPFLKDSIPVKSEIAKKIAVHRIKNSPLIFMKNCFYKPALLWGNNVNLNWSLVNVKHRNIFIFIGLLFHRIILILAGFFLFFAALKKDKKGVSFSLLFSACSICLVTFSHLFLEIQPRYHFILMPFVFVFAALFLAGQNSSSD